MHKKQLQCHCDCRVTLTSWQFAYILFYFFSLSLESRALDEPILTHWSFKLETVWSGT